MSGGETVPTPAKTRMDELLDLLSDLVPSLQRIADTLDPPRSKPNGKILVGSAQDAPET